MRISAAMLLTGIGITTIVVGTMITAGQVERIECPENHLHPEDPRYLRRMNDHLGHAAVVPIWSLPLKSLSALLLLRTPRLRLHGLSSATCVIIGVVGPSHTIYHQDAATRMTQPTLEDLKWAHSVTIPGATTLETWRMHVGEEALSRILLPNLRQRPTPIDILATRLFGHLSLELGNMPPRVHQLSDQLLHHRRPVLITTLDNI